MAHTFTIGSIRCHLLSDGQYLADGGAFFGLVPRVLWERKLTPNERNQIWGEMRSLLVESDAGLILIDVGYGDKLDAKLRGILGLGDTTNRLVDDLASVGYAPEDVDTVLLTHLHGDHAGGSTRWDEHQQPIPTFPNARYVCQRIDLADASFPNERTRATYHADNWQPLLDRGQLDVVDGPQRLAGGVRTQIAPGHTAALQVVWVESSGESLLFLGDACSLVSHMNRLAWVPAFDIFPMTSIETKRALRDEAFRRETLLVFQHDPEVATGRLVEGERGLEVASGG